MKPDIQTLAMLEREAILRAVAEYANPTEAAAALGIGKTTIYRKLKEYGVRRRCLQLEAKAEEKTDAKAVAQAEGLRSLKTPPATPQFLMLAITREEIQSAALVCPRCGSKVILPSHPLREIEPEEPEALVVHSGNGRSNNIRSK